VLWTLSAILTAEMFFKMLRLLPGHFFSAENHCAARIGRRPRLRAEVPEKERRLTLRAWRLY
jgi:hypothetical protein